MSKNIKVKEEKKNRDNFENIKVSTKTIIAKTNWNINIDKIYDILPTTHYIKVAKKRGRKRKDEKENPNGELPDGSIITVKYKDSVKGVDLKEKEEKKEDKEKKGKKKGYFRNNVTVVMMQDNKKINFKISRNGKFQMTGCENEDHAERCVKKIWDYIQERDDKAEVINISKETVPEITFIIVMTNIDFDVGFTINRENLDKYFTDNTEYNSLLESSIGYTGVNIKIPMIKPNDMVCKKLFFKNGKWDEGSIKYSDYINTLEEKDKEKEANKNRSHTFLVFHSGRVIMSSMHLKYMKDPYNHFLNIIRESRPYIEEKIEE